MTKTRAKKAGKINFGLGHESYFLKVLGDLPRLVD
jgi:hypothetical protein